MNPDTVFTINTNRFAHETVDGEVIMIDVDEGNYFSMSGSAAVIWRLLEDKVPFSAIVGALSTASGLPAEEIRLSVDALLNNLISEEILLESQDTGNTAVHLEPGSLVFAPPRFEKHTELQDLLTLDPIHEVDETGWPDPKKPGNN